MHIISWQVLCMCICASVYSRQYNRAVLKPSEPLLGHFKMFKEIACVFCCNPRMHCNDACLNVFIIAKKNYVIQNNKSIPFNHRSIFVLVGCQVVVSSLCRDWPATLVDEILIQINSTVQNSGNLTDRRKDRVFAHRQACT